MKQKAIIILLSVLVVVQFLSNFWKEEPKNDYYLEKYQEHQEKIDGLYTDLTRQKNEINELPELHIHVGVEADDRWEYGKTGNAVFYIPHYKVRVHLDNDTGKNVTPTFGCYIGTSIAGQKEVQSDYIHLPKDKPNVVGNAEL